MAKQCIKTLSTLRARKSGQGHEQDQRRGDDDPGSVGSVHFGIPHAVLWP
jgi:hypothetical protein